MGHGGGHHIKPTGDKHLPPVARDGQIDDRAKPPERDEQTPKNPKAHAAQMFERRWSHAHAGERRNNLAAMLGGEANSLPDARGGNVRDQIEQAKNLVNKSWDDLIGGAKQHKELEKFHDKPQKFWDNVRNMSRLETVETYVNGKLEQRAESRYGDLLGRLERFVGSGKGRLENFISSLPRGEREVFLARHLLNRAFGANELFVGRGVALDKSGRFPMREFLSANGKNPEMSAGAFLSLLGGDASGKTALAMLEQNGSLPNFQFLFNPSNAALFGLSLALCQNMNALLALAELAPEAFSPNSTNESIDAAQPQLAQSVANNTFESAENSALNAASKRAASGEALAAGALINGALATIEDYRKAKLAGVDFAADIKSSDDGFRFAAGATGAMMGATVGCVVPLAEKSVGEILGFASSVVVGLSDTGLRSLGSNALVSIITSGVQTFLSASFAAESVEKNLPESAANKFLNSAADFFENDLRENLFSSRADALPVS